ncbi:GNAT family N-acetyltransferase, partial [Vibrio cholerae O1]|nr:GNAT family N-acetyltransferase [Vibrio cholerae O1]
MKDKQIMLARLQEFETKRLLFRKIELSDKEDMFEYASDPEVVQYVSFPQHTSREVTEVSIVNYF